MSLVRDLRRDGKKSCDGNHNLVESEEAIAPTETHAVESGGRRRMGQKAIRALILRRLKKRSRPAVRAAAPTGHALKTPRGGPYSVIEGPHQTDTMITSSCNWLGGVVMGKVLFSLAFATAVLAVASSEASAASSFMCQAVGLRSVGYGRAYFVADAKWQALLRCERYSGICIISYCVPGY
jgi:hypothetical protein